MCNAYQNRAKFICVYVFNNGCRTHARDRVLKARPAKEDKDAFLLAFIPCIGLRAGMSAIALRAGMSAAVVVTLWATMLADTVVVLLALFTPKHAGDK